MAIVSRSGQTAKNDELSSAVVFSGFIMSAGRTVCCTFDRRSFFFASPLFFYCSFSAFFSWTHISRWPFKAIGGKWETETEKTRIELFADSFCPAPTSFSEFYNGFNFSLSMREKNPSTMILWSQTFFQTPPPKPLPDLWNNRREKKNKKKKTIHWSLHFFFQVLKLPKKHIYV